ncbi:MAG: hypothetical protein H0W48_00540 [Methylibium sp.]|nr:hypothetical protein [Methylibium sp.]
MSASLTIDGFAFGFVTASTDSGWPLDLRAVEEEVLESPGVHGRRWRTVFQQHRPFRLRTLAACTDFGAAVELARSYMAAIQRSSFARLTMNTPSKSRTWADVHVAGCDPRPAPGPVVGPGVTNAGASVLCVWTLEHTR